MTTHHTHLSIEPGGYVATCACGWIRYSRDEFVAEQYAQDHKRAHRPKEER